VRIVSLAQNVPGPAAVARLVAQGASAIKIEPPEGDQLERLCKPWYDELHAGVRVERLDLKSSAGMSALLRSLGSCDVFLTSQRPSALRRLAIDPAALARRLPALRHVAIVGDTTRPEHPGHDLTYLAEHGLMAREMPLTLIADMIGADRAAAAVSAVMHDPPGSTRIVGLADAVRDLAAPRRHGLTIPGGPLGGGDPAYRLYAARDGMVAVAALEPHFRARLFEGLGEPDGADLSDALARRTAAEWEVWAERLDIPLVAVKESSRES
jgi:crotonobetainyl-CoA:carnitine CoA-transferase CaiB-like acyl-CoA transferase